MKENTTAYCRNCGRMIQFALTKNNKWMPVNCELITIRPDKEGRLHYQGDRRPIFGRRCDPDEPGAVKVMEPHFYTCPVIIPKRAKASKAESAATMKEEQERQKEAQARARADKDAADRQSREWEQRQTSIFGK